MIATLMEVLDDDTMEALMALEPWDQAAIAFAFMVTAPRTVQLGVRLRAISSRGYCVSAEIRRQRARQRHASPRMGQPRSMCTSCSEASAV